MCLILIAKNTHPDFKLLLAANRDEFYNRPTKPIHWQESNSILSGIDESAGGTWLGMHKNGDIAALTNYRDMSLNDKNKASRGELVHHFLKEKQTANAFINYLTSHQHTYNPYNLLYGNMDNLFHYSNITGEISPLTDTVHGLSNHLLDTPWPKVERGKDELKKHCISGSTDMESIFAILKNSIQADDKNLPDTGIGLDFERILSSMFIHSKGYGTRCSTVIQVSHDNRVYFAERTFDTDGLPVDTIYHDFDVQEPT